MLYSCKKLVRYSTAKFVKCFKIPHSSLASNIALRKVKELPDGISLEILHTQTHDLSKVRKLLGDAFFLNQEPIMHTLCDRAYSELPAHEKLPRIEQQFETFFSNKFLSSKIGQGLSLLAIGDSDRYISSVFAEGYNGGIYKSELPNDAFWQHGLQLMGDVHKLAHPFLSQYDPGKVAFMSHAATSPEYATSGIMETIMEVFLSRLASHGFEAVYGIVTTAWLAKALGERFDYFPIAEIMYDEYKINGVPVFQHLAEKCVSAKAIVKFL